MGWKHGRVSLPSVDGDFPESWSNLYIACEIAVDLRRCHSQLVFQAIQAVVWGMYLSGLPSHAHDKGLRVGIAIGESHG